MASNEEPIQGYPLEQFLDDVPDRYLCTLCGLVARNIQLVNCCEKRFCLSCIKPDHNNKQLCPHCEDEEFDLMSLKKDKERISNLKVCCKERVKGCQWTGKLKDLQDHLLKEEGCQFSLKECQKCHQLISRCEMLHHLENACPEREHRCQYCNYQGSYDDVMRGHMPDCTYCPVVCPNQCGVTCERAQMYEHINKICPEQYLDCEYGYAGCEEKYRRKDKEKHMNTYKNDHKIMMEVHKQVTKMMKKYEEERERERASEQEKIERELHELRNKVDQLEHQLEQMRQEPRDQHVSHPYKHPAAAAIGENYNISKRKPKNQPQQVQQSSTHMQSLPINKPWISTIDKFTERKANQDKWESGIVQTLLGYRLQLNVWPNGQKDGEGDHVSVWLGYLSGVHDNRLPFPTQLTMKLELHDHFGTWDLLRTEKFILTGAYKYRFNYIGTFNNNKLISHERLHRRQFVQNDSILMCITLLEERILDPDELAVDDSLENYFDSQLEGQFLEPYNPQQD